jgi:hypothetical protein
MGVAAAAASPVEPSAVVTADVEAVLTAIPDLAALVANDSSDDKAQ